MNKISNFQIYCLLLVSIAPFSYLILPKQATEILANNSWIAILSSIIPSALLVFIYLYVIKKSSQPFPLLLEEHLGKILGKTLGFLFVLAFFFHAIITLRTFMSFLASVVMPLVPISVFISSMTLVSFYAIRKGLETFARVAEIIVLLGLPFSFIILILSATAGIQFRQIMPIAYMQASNFIHATSISTLHMTFLISIWVLAFYSNDINNISKTIYKVLITHILLISLTAIVSIAAFGHLVNVGLQFPTYSLVRTIEIGGFIQNIDIIFIAIWILGISVALTLQWFMSVYTLHKVFNLKDYRFLAAPTSLVIGTSTILMASNIMELQVIRLMIWPYILAFFFVLIPLILFLIVLFKPKVESALNKSMPVEEEKEV